MRLDWRGALGIAISVALLAYTLRDVSLAGVWAVLRASNVFLLLLSGAVATLVFPLRALRWRVILEPVASVPYGPLWRSVAVGMMVNNVAPARAGELARAFAITREARDVRFGSAFASLAVDRIIDALVIVILLVLSVFASSINPETEIATWTVRRLSWVAGGVAVVALAGVVTLAFVPSIVLRVYDGVFGRLAPRYHDRGRGLLEAFMTGLTALRSPGRFVRIIAWATAMWLVNALSFWIGFTAVGIEAPLAAALFVQSLIAIGVAAPSSPGFFGIFEFFGVAGLALYGVERELAVSWALGFHIISFIPITLIGLYYFGRLGMHFRDLGKPSGQPA